MADAVQRLFPGTKVTIGPSTAHGFYYDFDKPTGPFTDEDLAKIRRDARSSPRTSHSASRIRATRRDGVEEQQSRTRSS
jgi:threonyl-tRNA synthetase